MPLPWRPCPGAPALTPSQPDQCLLTSARQAAKVEEVTRRQAEACEVGGMVTQAYDSLDAERKKALTLLRGFEPGLADELRREFET